MNLYILLSLLMHLTPLGWAVLLLVAVCLIELAVLLYELLHKKLFF